MRFKHYCHLLFSILLVGCTIPRAAPVVDSISKSSDSIVVIGKVELEPPLDVKNEQTTHKMLIGDGAILNKIVLSYGQQYQPIKSGGYPNFKEWKNYIKADLGKAFMVRLPRGKMFINGGMVILDARDMGNLQFPGGFYLTTPQHASAIYIGTLRYTRNVFNSIKKIEILDEFSKTMTELQLTPTQVQNIQKGLLKRVE